MELVELGSSGLHVSRVGLGCNNFGGRVDLDGTRAVVEAALDAGVTFFDTAEVYGGGGGSERFLGEILEGRREEVVIATKFGWGAERGDGSAASVRAAIAGSLERLRTDYVDLYYLHKPDLSTPITETLSALSDLVQEGKVRAIGCSNFSAAQLDEAERAAQDLGDPRFTVLQNQYSLLERRDDADVLPLCRELDVSYIPYFPLASGLLTGKYRRGEPAPKGSRLEGREIEVPIYDRKVHTRLPETRRVAPARVVVLDGILILEDPAIRQLFDIKLFIDADPDIRFIRRLKRDLSERGRTLDQVIRQYESTVRPMHQQYVEPSKQYADVVIPGGGYNAVAIDMLMTLIRSLTAR